MTARQCWQLGGGAAAAAQSAAAAHSATVAARWQQRGGCIGFTGTVRECTDTHAFKCHQRANVRVFIIGQGWKDDSANGIVVVGSDGGARGDVHRGCHCTAVADNDAVDNNTANANADADGDKMVC